MADSEYLLANIVLTRTFLGPSTPRQLSPLSILYQAIELPFVQPFVELKQYSASGCPGSSCPRQQCPLGPENLVFIIVLFLKIFELFIIPGASLVLVSQE